MKKLKILIKLINEHLSFIIAVPAVLGGLWQLISLMAIDPAYIRFFSVTQLMADGLFIGTLLAASFLPPGLLLGLATWLRKFNKEEVDSTITTQEPVEKLGKIVILITIVVFAFLGGMFAYNIYQKFINEKLTITHFFLLPIFLFMLSGTYIALVLAFYFYRHNNKFEISERDSRVIVNLNIIIMLIASYFAMQNFNKSFLIPANLENTDKILGLDKTYKIVYFNDSYIFLEKTTGSKTTVKVLKFEAFFDNTNTQTN